MRLYQSCALALLLACGSGSSHANAVTAGGDDGGSSSGGGSGGGGSGGGGDGGDGSDVAMIPTSPADAGRPPPDPCIASSSCPAGVWINVTPAGLDLNPASFNGDNYGVQDVLVDPARPSDIYAFTCYQGVWKSTNYGQTWTGPINTGANGSVLMTGRQWCGAISNADVSAPPTIWTCNGYGHQTGVWKSTDGAVSWTNYSTLPSSFGTYAQDVYSIVVDPYDANHLLTGFHELPGVALSADGGKTWTNVTGNLSSAGISYYPFFIDTGDAKTTAQTWIAVAQQNGGTAGTWRTTNAGATWTQVEKNEHPHGASQLFQYKGVVYLAGQNGSQGSGVYRSTDFGATWTYPKQPGAQESVVWGTATDIHTMYGFPQTAPNWETTGQPGTGGWTASATPAAMNSGPKVVAVTSDGNNHIFIGGMWEAGLWRYIAP